MPSPVRSSKPERTVQLIAVAVWVLGVACGGSSANAPDAGVDAAPDAAGTDSPPDVSADMTNPSDGAAADVATDANASDATDATGTSDGAGSDGGSTDGGDGGGDLCHPPCRERLYGGCPPEGTCVYSGLYACFSNGVITVNSAPGGTTKQTLMKNGVVCATLDATNVWRDPNGAALGTLKVNSDGSNTLTCTGEAPVTVPASCTIGCSSGKCPP